VHYEKPSEARRRKAANRVKETCMSSSPHDTVIAPSPKVSSSSPTPDSPSTAAKRLTAEVKAGISIEGVKRIVAR